MSVDQPPAAQPAAWISEESFYHLQRGGNKSRGSVPVHANPSKVSKRPLYLQPDPRLAVLEGLLARAFKMANDRRNHEHFAALADDIAAALKEG